MLTYLVSSKDELERIEHIQALKSLFPELVSIEAIYPRKSHIPFYSQIKSVSKFRTGTALADGALGCLLSHRVIWRRFLNQKDQDFCIILESDSKIENLTMIHSQKASIKAQYDLFFWGAFDNRMKLLQSTKIHLDDPYQIGTPLVNSLYCTYGYSINKNAAAFLLESTKKFNYPVDYWKLRLKNSPLRVGGILPNIITTVTSFKSTISHPNQSFFVLLFDTMINFKNSIISFFK
jgi:GR25 family glycosyltransferase involved in LPS biosynthesis